MSEREKWSSEESTGNCKRDFHEWNEATGALSEGCGWFFEMEGICEDADTRQAAMYAMLKRLEWVKNDDGHLFCATCWRREIEGHAPDCELDALLKLCTGEV